MSSASLPVWSSVAVRLSSRHKSAQEWPHSAGPSASEHAGEPAAHWLQITGSCMRKNTHCLIMHNLKKKKKRKKKIGKKTGILLPLCIIIATTSPVIFYPSSSSCTFRLKSCTSLVSFCCSSLDRRSWTCLSFSCCRALSSVEERVLLVWHCPKGGEVGDLFAWFSSNGGDFGKRGFLWCLVLWTLFFLSVWLCELWDGRLFSVPSFGLLTVLPEPVWLEGFVSMAVFFCDEESLCSLVAMGYWREEVCREEGAAPTPCALVVWVYCTSVAALTLWWTEGGGDGCCAAFLFAISWL